MIIIPRPKRSVIKSYLYEFTTNIGGFCGWLLTFFPTGAFAMAYPAVPAFYFIYYLFKYPGSGYLSLYQTPLAFKIAIICFLYMLYCNIYLIWMRIKQKGLVTTGPYKFIRHPQYLAMIGLILSMTISVYSNSRVDLIWPTQSYSTELSKSILPLVCVGQIGVYILLIVMEELHLESHFPDDFLDYREYTWFLFPKIPITKEKATQTLRQYLGLITQILLKSLGWILLFCTGIPVYRMDPSSTLEYITVKPMGYELFSYIMRYNNFSGFTLYLRDHVIYAIAMVIALVGIGILLVIQRIKAIVQRKIATALDGNKTKLEKIYNNLSVLTNLCFLGISLTLNILSLIFRKNYPYLGSWEMSDVLIYGILFSQIFVQSILFFVNKAKKSITNSNGNKLALPNDKESGLSAD